MKDQLIDHTNMQNKANTHSAQFNALCIKIIANLMKGYLSDGAGKLVPIC
jgi:hypothetical protein